MSDWERWLDSESTAREHASLERQIWPTEGATEPWAVRDGERMLNLSSNSYLGLAGHPTLREASTRGAARSAGAGASRLVTGSDAAYRALEEQVALLKGTERSLVLGSGYLANVGTLASVLDRSCGVISDALNHASIIDGIRLSRAHVYRYEHADPGDLRAKLEEANGAGHSRLLIVTDTVFSMDGDVAPLAEIVELKERYGAALMIDDAHGTGVFGAGGAGYANELGLTEHVDIQVGTFSKAFGAYGAYAAASERWIEQIVNSSRTLTYSTGLPPALIETIAAAVPLVREADRARAELARKAERFRESLQDAELDTAGSATQIVPLVVRDTDASLELARRLRTRGLLAQAIRWPTVPRGSARVRFSLMASHADDALEQASSTIVEEARSLVLRPS